MYIKREDALDIIGSWRMSPDGDRAYQEIAELPTKNVQSAEHGKWEYKVVLDENGKMDFCSRRWYCSVCGEWQTYGQSAYCPNCGADMLEVDDG